MIWSSIKEMRSEKGEIKQKSFSWKLLLVQAVATSIDALAVGAGFTTAKVNIFAMSTIIAVITFVCCLVAALIGKKFGKYLGEKAELIGGIILVGIGIEIFVEHLFF